MSRPNFLPPGFRVAAVSCGIKRDPNKLDMTLFVSDRPAAAAGVFTQNRLAAAPVQVSRTRVPAAGVRAIIANSGNANACTGERGLADARRMTDRVAERLGCPAETVLVCSTGVIGTPLPMPLIDAGIGRAFEHLSDGPDSLPQAARGIMTTDTVPKMTTREAELDGRTVRLAGIAKGAAMIGPNMATMLCFVTSDAAIDHQSLQSILRSAVDRSFNMISVEGHMSTNDTVLAVANGAAGGPPLVGAVRDRFAELLTDVCSELAQAIVRDAEGAKHFVTIDVEGLRTAAEAKRVAKVVAESPLVKTAICGADPNWGRFVSAAGYAGVEFAEHDLSCWLDGVLLYDHGTPVRFDAEAVSKRLHSQRDVNLRLKFELGIASSRFWTCDLTEEYIKLNADYRT
jgi:glutamate N-acetyltransferase/amino-acid N-acetyltransferase